MNYLTLKSIPTGKNQFTVYWSIWGQGAQLVDVTLSDDQIQTAHREIAELEVIRWLLQEQEVFGAGFSGRGLSIQTNNHDLIDVITHHFCSYEGRYMTFLPIMYFNSVINHVDAADALDSQELRGSSTLIVEKPNHVTVNTELLGEVAITMNAVARYVSNLKNGYEMKDPFRSLKAHLQRDDMEVVDPETNRKLWPIAAFIEDHPNIDLVTTSPFTSRYFLFTEPDRSNIRHLVSVFIK